MPIVTVELLDPNVAKIYSKSKRAKVRGKGRKEAYRFIYCFTVCHDVSV